MSMMEWRVDQKRRKKNFELKSIKSFFSHGWSLSSGAVSCWAEIFPSLFSRRSMFHVYLPFNPFFIPFNCLVIRIYFPLLLAWIAQPDRSYLSQSNETISLSFFIFTFFSYFNLFDFHLEYGVETTRQNERVLTTQTKDKEWNQLDDARVMFIVIHISWMSRCCCCLASPRESMWNFPPLIIKKICVVKEREKEVA